MFCARGFQKSSQRSEILENVEQTSAPQNLIPFSLITPPSYNNISSPTQKRHIIIHAKISNHASTNNPSAKHCAATLNPPLSLVVCSRPRAVKREKLNSPAFSQFAADEQVGKASRSGWDGVLGGLLDAANGRRKGIPLSCMLGGREAGVWVLTSARSVMGFL